MSAPTKKMESAKKGPQIGAMRESVETVAVVLALVTLLRGFVAEAYVIPTGSMAPTLLGAHRQMTCPQCGYHFVVGASTQEKGLPVITNGGLCQNCRFPTVANGPFMSGRDGFVSSQAKGEFGDRLIVAKYQYEIRPLKRWDIAVFKYPAEEVIQTNSYPSRTNFIKRIVGLPGDEIIIYYGDLFIRSKGEANFAIAAKPPQVMLKTRRLVFDNDYQPADLVAQKFPSRWYVDQAGGAKSTPVISADRKSFAVKGGGSIAYRHLIGGGERSNYPRPLNPDLAKSPQLVADFESYNRPYGYRLGHRADKFGSLEFLDDQIPGMADGVGSNWVGDLMLEGTVDIKSLTGSVTMELVEATRTLGCSISLDGSGSVARLMNGNKVLAEQRCPITGPGSYEIRFANFDDRLVLWVNDQLVFGNGIALDRLTPEDNGPTKRDLSPARWSFSNVDLTLKHIRLFRDIYYTRVAGPGDEHPVPYALEQTELDQLTYWQKSLATTFQRDWAYTSHPAIPGEGAVYQVPEGHYMACGDNSPRSFDGRGWRLSSFIPIQCLMGKGVVRYWPIEWPFWFPKYVE